MQGIRGEGTCVRFSVEQKGGCSADLEAFPHFDILLEKSVRVFAFETLCKGLAIQAEVKRPIQQLFAIKRFVCVMQEIAHRPKQLLFSSAMAGFRKQAGHRMRGFVSGWIARRIERRMAANQTQRVFVLANFLTQGLVFALARRAGVIGEFLDRHTGLFGSDPCVSFGGKALW